MQLYVDDMRPCPKGFTLARSAEECLTLLESCHVQVLSLDHDMGWNCMNGTQLAEQMVKRGLYADYIYLHSSSPMGRMAMFQLLYREKPEHVQLRSHPMPDELLERIAAGLPPFADDASEKREMGEE